MVKHGCDLTLFDTWEFAVERRIDGEGTDFGQSVNEEHNGEELFHLSPLPACTGGLLSQDQLADEVLEDHRSRNSPKGTSGSHVWLRKSLTCKYLGAEQVQPGQERSVPAHGREG